MRRAAFLTCCLILLAGPAAAQGIDNAGADRLTADLKRYLGDAAFSKGIVAVAPDGDAYALTLDLDAFAAMLPAEAEAKVDIEPYALRLTPLKDGMWSVAGPLFPGGSAEFKGPNGRQTVAWAVADSSFEGVYDPALAAFTSATGRHGPLSLKVDDAAQKVDVSIQSGAFSITGTKTPSGGVDFAMTQDQKGFVEIVQGPAEASLQPTEFTLRADSLKAESTGSNFNSRRMLDLVAFLVANADETRIKANQAELKRLVLAVLPFWDRMEGGQTFESISVETPIGPVSVGSFGLNVAMSGVTDGATVGYGVSLEQPKLPDGLLPPWAVALMPTRTELNFAGVNLQLDTALRKAVEAFDLNRTPPLDPAVGDEIAALFLGAGPKFVIEPSIIRNADTTLTFSGEVKGQPGQNPDVDLTVEASGYDALVRALTEAAATDPIAQQAQPVALAGQSMAKRLPDGRLQWIFKAAPDGSVRVNGAMLKPADAPAPPAAPGIPGTLQKQQ